MSALGKALSRGDQRGKSYKVQDLIRGRRTEGTSSSGMGRRPGAGACDLDASCGTLGTRPEFTGVGFDDRNHRYLLRADADQSRLAPPSCCAVTRCRHDRGAQRRQVPRAVLKVTGLLQARCHDE